MQPCRVLWYYQKMTIPPPKRAAQSLEVAPSTDPQVVFERACGSGDVAVVAAYMTQVDINRLDGMGLSLAAVEGHTDIVGLLIPLSTPRAIGCALEATAQRGGLAALRMLAPLSPQKYATSALVAAMAYRSPTTEPADILAPYAHVGTAVSKWLTASVGDLPVNIHWGVDMITALLPHLTQKDADRLRAVQDPTVVRYMEWSAPIQAFLSRSDISLALGNNQPDKIPPRM